MLKSNICTKNKLILSDFKALNLHYLRSCHLDWSFAAENKAEIITHDVHFFPNESFSWLSLCCHGKDYLN